MKILLLVAALLFLILTNMFGEIRNGYQRDISEVRASLQRLKDKLSGKEHLSGRERREIKENIGVLTNYLTYYEVTEILLHRFRTISSGLYQEINDLKDGKGRSVHVYVKFIPEYEEMGSMGMVALIPSSLDSIGCRSEYGGGTASIKVRTNNKALLVLSHEFGHLSYIVPNLRSYISYYKDIYRAKHSLGELGHLRGDPSGLNAYRFERRHRLDHVNYLRQDLPKEPTPMALVLLTQRGIADNLNHEKLSVATVGW